MVAGCLKLQDIIAQHQDWKPTFPHKLIHPRTYDINKPVTDTVWEVIADPQGNIFDLCDADGLRNTGMRIRATALNSDLGPSSTASTPTPVYYLERAAPGSNGNWQKLTLAFNGVGGHTVLLSSQRTAEVLGKEYSVRIQPLSNHEKNTFQPLLDRLKLDAVDNAHWVTPNLKMLELFPGSVGRVVNGTILDCTGTAEQAVSLGGHYEQQIRNHSPLRSAPDELWEVFRFLKLTLYSAANESQTVNDMGFLERGSALRHGTEPPPRVVVGETIYNFGKTRELYGKAQSLAFAQPQLTTYYNLTDNHCQPIVGPISNYEQLIGAHDLGQNAGTWCPRFENHHLQLPGRARSQFPNYTHCSLFNTFVSNVDGARDALTPPNRLRRNNENGQLGRFHHAVVRGFFKDPEKPTIEEFGRIDCCNLMLAECTENRPLTRDTICSAVEGQHPTEAFTRSAMLQVVPVLVRVEGRADRIETLPVVLYFDANLLGWSKLGTESKPSIKTMSPLDFMTLMAESDPQYSFMRDRNRTNLGIITSFQSEWQTKTLTDEVALKGAQYGEVLRTIKANRGLRQPETDPFFMKYNRGEWRLFTEGHPQNPQEGTDPRTEPNVVFGGTAPSAEQAGGDKRLYDNIQAATNNEHLRNTWQGGLLQRLTHGVADTNVRQHFELLNIKPLGMSRTSRPPRPHGQQPDQLPIRPLTPFVGAPDRDVLKDELNTLLNEAPADLFDRVAATAPPEVPKHFEPEALSVDPDMLNHALTQGWVRFGPNPSSPVDGPRRNRNSKGKRGRRCRPHAFRRLYGRSVKARNRR